MIHDKQTREKEKKFRKHRRNKMKAKQRIKENVSKKIMNKLNLIILVVMLSTLTFGLTLTYDTNANLPSCNAGEFLLTVNGNWVCYPFSSGFSLVCENGEYTSYNNVTADWECAAAPSVELPTCSSRQILISNGTHFECGELPTTIDDIECVNGEILDYSELNGWECASKPVNTDDQTLQEVVSEGDTTTLNIKLDNASLCLDSACNHRIFRGDALGGDIEHAITFFNDENLDGGEITFVMAYDDKFNAFYQAGLNNSYSAATNSNGVIPNNVCDYPEFQDAGNCNLSKVSNYVTYCAFVQSEFGLVDEGCKYFADTTGRILPLFFTGDLEVMRTAVIHEGLTVFNSFNYVSRDGEDFEIIFTNHGGASEGNLHTRNDLLLLQNITYFNITITDFDGLNIFPFVSKSIAPETNRDWRAEDVPQCLDDACAIANGGNSKIMEISSGTSFLNNTVVANNNTLSFYLTTESMTGASEFYVEIDDNQGNTSTIYSTTVATTLEYVRVEYPALYDGKENVTSRFIFDGQSVVSSAYVDLVRFEAVPQSTIEYNELYQGSRHIEGEDMGDLSCGSYVTKEIDPVTLLPVYIQTIGCPDGVTRVVGDVEQQDITITSQNVTGDVEALSFTLNGTTILNWDSVLSNSFFLPLNYYNKSEVDGFAMLENLNCTDGQIAIYNSTGTTWQCDTLTAGVTDPLEVGTIQLDYTNITSFEAVQGDSFGNISFSNTNAYVELYDLTIENKSFSFWYKGGLDTTSQRFMAKGDTASSYENDFLLTRFSSGLQLDLIMGCGNDYNRFRTDSSVLSNTGWHHILVYVQDADNVDFYHDGSLAANTQQNNGCDDIYNSADEFHLGHDENYGATYDYNGMMDEFAYYDGDVGSSGALALYNLGRDNIYINNVSKTNLINYYSFDGGDVSDDHGSDDGISSNVIFDSVGTPGSPTVAYFEHEVSATGYVTRTPKDVNIVQKILTYMNDLPEVYITDEGKITKDSLFEIETSPFGTYKVDSMTFVNRAWLIELSKDYKLTKQRLKEVENTNTDILNCFDLTVQSEIITCMRDLN